mgnify:CR=1 FL=1
MAGELVANVIADALVAMPDMANDASCLRWLNVIHKELCEEFQIVTASADLTLSTATRDYDLSDTYAAVWSAEYRSSSTAYPIPLERVSVAEYDVENAAWRNTSQGQPTAFYMYTKNDGTPSIGFDRIPSTATSGGYPTVRIYVSLYTALTSNGNLPASIRDYMVYVWGLCYKFAQFRHQDEAAQYGKFYEDAKNALGVYMGRKQRHNPPRQIPMLRAGVAAS